MATRLTRVFQVMLLTTKWEQARRIIEIVKSERTKEAKRDKDCCTLVAVSATPMYEQANIGARAPVMQLAYLLYRVFGFVCFVLFLLWRVCEGLLVSGTITSFMVVA